MDAAVGEPSLTAARDAPLGGQAVLEGVMMRGVAHWAVAVRKPAESLPPPAHGLGSDAESMLGPIEVQTFTLSGGRRRHRLFRLPLVRGVSAMVESLVIGLRALSIAANAQLEDGEDAEVADGTDAEGSAGALSGGVWFGTILVSVVFAVGLFFIVPLSATSLIRHQLGSSWAFWLVEGALRTVIFLGYLALLAKLPDLRRTFEYHGAEHKTISCYEAGDELVPERAALYSRFHPRCGTSFLLVVMIVSIFVFAPVGLHAWWILVLTRVAGVPVITGISFEIIRWAGRHRTNRFVQAVMSPGMQLQKLTTREPTLDQLAVAIAALEAVLAHETPGELTADDLVGVEVVA